jgi:hypothetical protein
MHDNETYRDILARMNQLAVVTVSGLESAHDGSQDAKLVELWVSEDQFPYQAGVHRRGGPFL